MFRAGLKKRGLTELLELHLKDFPPTSKTEAMLMMREVKLAEFADPSQSRRQREAAIAEANGILEELIQARAFFIAVAARRIAAGCFHFQLAR